MALRSCRPRIPLRVLAVIIAIISTIFLAARLYKEMRSGPNPYPRKRHDFKESADIQEWADFHNERLDSKGRRRSILVIAHGRSGSTITGEIFNHNPSVFYLHEPLQTVERISKQNGSNKDRYASLMINILSNILRCNFSQAVLEDFDHFYREPSHSRASCAIGSPPLCPHEMTDPKWDLKLCPPLTNESLGTTCRNKYAVTVAKILMSRIAGNDIKNILQACRKAKSNCQIIFLIKDPRAVIPSSRSVGFSSDRGSRLSKDGLRLFSYQNCKQTEDNLVFLKNLPLSWRRRILVQRYEDFAVNPLKVMSRLYDFAGLPVLDHVKIWLNKSTHPSKKREDMLIEGSPAFFMMDDASATANRWRWKVHPHDIDIIEHYCKHVMQIMGYIPINNDEDLMADVTTPLFSEGYEAKKWFPN